MKTRLKPKEIQSVLLNLSLILIVKMMIDLPTDYKNKRKFWSEKWKITQKQLKGVVEKFNYKEPISKQIARIINKIIVLSNLGKANHVNTKITIEDNITEVTKT